MNVNVNVNVRVQRRFRGCPIKVTQRDDLASKDLCIFGAAEQDEDNDWHRNGAEFVLGKGRKKERLVKTPLKNIHYGNK